VSDCWLSNFRVCGERLVQRVRAGLACGHHGLSRWLQLGRAPVAAVLYMHPVCVVAAVKACCLECQRAWLAVFTALSLVVPITPCNTIL